MVSLNSNFETSFLRRKLSHTSLGKGDLCRDDAALLYRIIRGQLTIHSSGTCEVYTPNLRDNKIIDELSGGGESKLGWETTKNNLL